MCTSIYLKTKDHHHLLSRTMDFAFPLEAKPTYLPRNYQWKSCLDARSHQNKYGFIGAGRLLGESYFVADGVNEKGLAVAELYLPGEVNYRKNKKEEALNLAPHEFILWLLGHCASIEEVEDQLKNIHLVSAKAPILDIVTPLHWIITDTTGRCVIIEPTEIKLMVKENPIGVLTNTPYFEWHLDNLRNYLHVQPEQYKEKRFGNYIARPFSQGTGTLGLPGGYTPPERFVRAAFFREHIEEAPTEEAGVRNAYHVLATVRIPKGIVIDQDGHSDYSQYVGTMCNETQSYYFTDYDHPTIVKVCLDKKLLAKNNPCQFDIEPGGAIKTIN
ncbi:choloylglycine hydrolase family protein [Vagococcus sp.]|uniref:choloylglycine hydrolase family protein n=1 Tax=Vagococcus sp. TaxID=1933889 RepID=UPI003F9C9629